MLTVPQQRQMKTSGRNSFSILRKGTLSITIIFILFTFVYLLLSLLLLFLFTQLLLIGKSEGILVAL